MGRQKKHHWVSVLLLDRFTNADGKLWVADRRRGGDLRCQAPKEVCFQNNRNTLQLAEGVHDTSLEDWMSELEAPITPILWELDNRQRLSDLARKNLSKFVGLQAARSPDADKARDAFAVERLRSAATSPAALRLAMLEMDQRDDPAGLTVRPSDPDDPFWIKTYDDLFAGRFELEKVHQRFQAVRTTIQLAVQFFHKGWEIIHLPDDAQFAISSNPAIRLTDGIWLPLGSKMAIRAADGLPEFTHRDGRGRHASWANEQAATNADELLCGADPELIEGLRKIWTE